ncbi:uncharacterized protein LOC110687893 [Chenopodium quinoa]|uniref:uncharacterized protein LOC110687893 n=1 Tax=Chenopodium quinoa TaxID=63459 RepID=UPI000B773EF0|nr:uncharacterized protein LOC110687893 [Chenopodium quinoa]
MKSNNTIGFLWVLPFFMLTISANFGISAAQPLHHQDQGLNENAESRDLKKEHEHIYEVHCSRERSRAAWETVDKYLMHFVERERYKIPRSCRLHPDNDLFRDQEQHKIKMDVNEWQCGYCKKSFLSEEFLDRHFDSRHYNLLNFTGSKCLADLCGALHCDHVLNTKSPKAKCNHAAAARNRHLCESLADACFPVTHGPSASRLHELFLQQFCYAHTCSGGKKPFSRGGRKETSLLYFAASILIIMLLPLFYVLVCLHQSEIRKDTQELKRISRLGRKAKPI